MYTKRFTRQPWWPKIKLLYDRGYLKNFEDYQIFLRAPPATPQLQGNQVITESADKMDLFNMLYENLLKVYPDLKYVPIQQIPKLGESASQENFILSFIKKQKSLMEAGYTVDKSFEMTEKVFQDRIRRRVNDSLLNRQVAVTNKMRSLMTYYQQRAEFESRLKVQRMKRDLPTFMEARQKDKHIASLEEEYEQLQEEEEEESELTSESYSDVYGVEQSKQQKKDQVVLDNQQQQQQKNPKDDLRSKYERVLTRIVQSNVQDTKPKQEVIQEFLDRTQNIMRLYYQRAAVQDRLSGLTDEEILSKLRESPSKIKSRGRQLLRKLQKVGVRLDEKGEVDYTRCTKPYLVEKLRRNPLVKMVLLQQNLDFEFPHKEYQRQMANELRREVEQRKQNIEQQNQQSQQVIENQILEDKAQYQQTINQSGSYNNQVRFDYGIEQKGISNGNQENGVLDNDNNIQNQVGNRRIMKNGQQINVEDIYYQDSVYKLFESNEERMARLEEKWLKVRLASLESNLEKPTLIEQSETLQRAVEKVRRIKWRVDQQMLKNAQDLLFEEHQRFTQDDLLVDEDVQIEMLEHYLRQSEDIKKDTPRKELDDEKIMRAITRKQLVEDTVKPFQDYGQELLTENDVKEYIRQQEQIDSENKLISLINSLQDIGASSQQQYDVQTEAVGDIDFDTVGNKTKEERQKIVEFIKKSSIRTKPDTPDNTTKNNEKNEKNEKTDAKTSSNKGTKGSKENKGKNKK